MQALLVALLDRLRGLVVELVQAVVDPVLPLAHQPDDHCSISFFASPEPSSAFICASSESTWDDDESCASSRSSCVWSEVKSSSVPASVSSSIAFARACICSVLSF